MKYDSLEPNSKPTAQTLHRMNCLEKLFILFLFEEKKRIEKEYKEYFKLFILFIRQHHVTHADLKLVIAKDGCEALILLPHTQLEINQGLCMLGKTSTTSITPPGLKNVLLKTLYGIKNRKSKLRRVKKNQCRNISE